MTDWVASSDSGPSLYYYCNGPASSETGPEATSPLQSPYYDQLSIVKLKSKSQNGPKIGLSTGAESFSLTLKSHLSATNTKVPEMLYKVPSRQSLTKSKEQSRYVYVCESGLDPIDCNSSLLWALMGYVMH